MPSALIIGVDSTIGSALKKRLNEEGWLVYGTSRKIHIGKDTFHLDLANASTFCFNQPVDVVFICAGITGIAACEHDVEYSRHINFEAPIVLAKYFLNRNTHVVYLSSNAVFNGLKPKYKITDPTCPNTIYGKYKEQVEKELLKLSKAVSIVRLTKVLTDNYYLILQWIDALKNGISIAPHQDVFFSPVPVDIVTYFLKEIAENKLRGIYHLSGDEDVNYGDLANYLGAAMNVNKSLIEPKFMLESSAAIGRERHYASLDNAYSKELVNIPDLSFSATINGLFGHLLM